MISFEQTLTDQENLATLCADRPLVTNELFTPNAFYGMDFILKEYAGLPSEYQLKMVIPHGMYYGESYLYDPEKLAPVPAVFCYSEFRRGVYARETKKFVVNAASPFLYLLEMMKSQPQVKKEGTIFFPAHSTHHITALMDVESLADKVLALNDEYKPLTICIYWKDYLLGRHLPFLRRGMRVVSAGHMFDPLFLYRFYHLCSSHRYAASNEVGSNLFYSLKAGCSFFLIEEEVTLVGDEEEQDLETRSKRPPEIRSLFHAPVAQPTEKQIEMVDSYLGSEYIQSPAELNQLFRYLEFADRFGILVYNRGYPPKLVIPSRFQRNGLPLQNQYWWGRRKLGGLKRRIRRLGMRKPNA